MNEKNNDDEDYKHSKEIKTSIKNLFKDMNEDKKTFTNLQDKIAQIKEE